MPGEMNMKNNYVIGMDFGTSGVKGLLYDAGLHEIVKLCYREYPMLVPEPNFAEHDPEKWWESFLSIIKEMKNEIEVECIRAISISCHTPTLTAIDRDGKVLKNGFIWADARSEMECREIIENYGAEIAKINPQEIRSYHILPKLFWFIRHEREKYDKTWKFLENNGYINYKLTGVAGLDRSQAPSYHFYNVHTQEYDQSVAEKIGVDLTKFPKLYNCGDIIGTVTSEAAECTGLSTNTMVIAGMADVTADVLGMGIFTDHKFCYSGGTGGHAMMMTRSSVPGKPFTADSRIITQGGYSPEYMLNVGVLSNIGGALKWVRNALGNAETEIAGNSGLDVYDVLVGEANTSPIGSNGLIFLPYLVGELCPIFKPDARGCFYGISPETNKSDMIRAVLEGVAFAERQVIEVSLGAYGNMDLSELGEIIVTGGPAKSAVWMQILSDVIGTKIVTPDITEAAPLGNLILAGNSAGLFDMQEEIKYLVKSEKRYSPDPQNSLKYCEFYQRFLKLQNCLMPCFEKR